MNRWGKYKPDCFDDGLEGPNIIHAAGPPMSENQTLCGHVWRNDIVWTTTRKAVTCDACLDFINFVHDVHPRATS